MSFTVEFWSGLKCSSGTRLAVAASVISASASYSLDHNDTLSLVVPWSEPWLATMKLRNVVRVTEYDAAGTAFRINEWRLSAINDSRTATVTLTADPIFYDLGTEIVADLRNGRTYYDLGLYNSTPQQYVETFVLPGASWLGLGSFDLVSRHDIAGARWTRAQWMKTLAERAGGEIDFRRNGDTNYLVGIVAARSSSVAQRLLRTDRQVIELQRSRRSETLRTVMVAVGKVPEGDIEAASIAYATWKITAISGNDVTLADPLGGAGPVGFTDQFSTASGAHLLKPDGTLTAISASTTGQVLTVASAAGLAVNDHVEIRKNSSGDQLTELTNPSAVATYGRVVGTAENTDARGERNHLPNPFMSDWTGGEVAVRFGRVNGGHSATTTLVLDGLPASIAIAANDLVDIGINGVHKVQTGGTTDGSGNITLTMHTAVTALDNAVVRVHHTPTQPTGWSKSDTDAQPIYFNRIDPTLTTALSGAVVGAHTAEGGVTVDGLTVGGKIQAGDILEIGATPVRVGVRGPVTVNGAGVAVIATDENVTASDNDAIVVRRPSFAGVDVGSNAMFVTPTADSTAYLKTPAYKIRADANTPLIWCAVGYSIFAPRGETLAVAGTPTPPKIQIHNFDTEALLGSLQDEDRTLVALDQADVTLRKSIQLTTSTKIYLRIYPIALEAFGTADAWMLLRWVQVSVGPDSAVPPIEGSHANKLWQLANEMLVELAAEPFTLHARIVELARMNPDLTSETTVIGQGMRVMADDMAGDTSLDVTTRVTQLRNDLADSRNDNMTLESLPPRLIDQFERMPRLFVQENGEVADGPDPLAAGALRGGVPLGQTPGDDGTGAQNLTPFEPA